MQAQKKSSKTGEGCSGRGREKPGACWATETKREASLRRKIEEGLSVPTHKGFPRCQSTHTSSFSVNAASREVRPPENSLRRHASSLQSNAR